MAEEPTLDGIQEYLVSLMDATDPADTKYSTYLDHLKKIEEVRNLAASRRISKEAVLSAVTSLAGIIAILGYEHFLPVTSKAFGLLLKIRL